jgi:hypothetical protein
MKILFSFLFYVIMAGTTASVGADLKVPAPVVTAPAAIKREVTPAKPDCTEDMPKGASSFKALGVRQSKAGAVITWAVTPSTVSTFIVENSNDGKNFSQVATVTPTDASAYKFCDASNATTSGYYRITALKTNGCNEYSAAKKIRLPR